jgi:transposase
MVNEWVKRFNEEGLDGLKEKPLSGRPRALSPQQLEELKAYVLSHGVKPSGGRLKGTLVITFVEQDFGVSFSLTNIYRVLHRLDFSWITSRSKHPKQSQAAEDEFKENENGSDQADPGSCDA